MIDASNPLWGSMFNLLMSAYGGSGSGAESGFGARPSTVEGPSMADGGFYSQPQGMMAGLMQGSGGGGGLGSTLGGAGGGALGSYFGPVGTMVGSKIGSMAGSLLGGSGSGPAPLTPPPAPKPLSRVSPSDQFNIQRAIESLPPELREPFSRSFGVY